MIGYRRILIVTAVEAERAAVLAALDRATPDHAVPDHASEEPARTSGEDALGNAVTAVTVVAGGVGPAAAAAATARALTLAEAAGSPYHAVLCAGIAGGYPEVTPLGGIALATESVVADLGADSPAGFLGLDELGFGPTVAEVDRALLAAMLGALPGAVTGPILTVSTTTGTSERAAALRTRYPAAVAEAMEGYGTALAAAAAGVAFGELRAISNFVGPRDRSGWRIPAALTALTAATRAITT